jgi:hypothetical protein
MTVSGCLWCLLFPKLNLVPMNELHPSNPIFFIHHLLPTYIALTAV